MTRVGWHWGRWSGNGEMSLVFVSGEDGRVLVQVRPGVVWWQQPQLITEWGPPLLSLEECARLKVRAEAAEAAINAAIDASDNGGGSASDAIQDMLGILRADESEADDGAAG